MLRPMLALSLLSAMSTASIAQVFRPVYPPSNVSLAQYPGITFITWEGSPFDTPIVRNMNPTLSLIKAGRYQDKHYFYVYSRKVAVTDQIIIKLTNGNRSIFGTIYKVLGVVIDYYNASDAVVHRINYYENVDKPAVARSFNVPEPVFKYAKYMRIQWYRANTPNSVRVSIGASGTFSSGAW